MPSITITAGVTDAIGTRFNATAVASNNVSSTIQVGDTTVYPTTDGGNGNLLLAQQITLAQTCSPVSLSFYVKSAAGNLRLGLYSGQNSPGAKVAECAEFTPVPGWNTKPTLTQPMLQPGNYWLVYFPQSDALTFQVNRSTAMVGFYEHLTYGALPAMFLGIGSLTGTGAHWSFYGTFAVGPPPPPDTTPPSTPTGVTATEI